MDLFDGVKDILKNIFSDLKYTDWIKWVAVKNNWEDDCDKFHNCWFIYSQMPNYPQYYRCMCRLQKIEKPVPYKTAFAVCDIEKFTHYIFNAKYNDGKQQIFENWGFNVNDSEFLQKEYENQALEKYCKGEYIYKGVNARHAKIEIVIELKNKNNIIQYINTGWEVKPNGRIRLVTPYSGHIYRRINNGK